MANPVIVPCPEGAWTKVATNVTTGTVHIINESPDKYTHTYRDTTAAAPTTQAEAIPFNVSLEIQNSTGIDVYIWPLGAAGEVRVDS